MLSLSSWPQAILHLDADAFFASVEQALHPEYREKAVITGKERNIVACASYEAKRRGVVRAMPLNQARQICPEAIVVPSDYETYSIFSKRMFAIMREFTPEVEEYSIDEGFADLTGLRRVHKTSYEGIALMIKKSIEEELGITVSIGLSLSKSLAKLASKKHKPAGFTPIPGRQIEALLRETALYQVWGFGPNTTAFLTKLGLKTAYDFVMKSQNFAQKKLGKVGDELWRELRGEYVYKIITEAKDSYQSISKMKTFTPPSTNPDFVYGQLVRNLESACIKARRYQLVASDVSIYLRAANFAGDGLDIQLSRPSSYPTELVPLVHQAFYKLFRPKRYYRATGIVLHHLTAQESLQPTLFEDPLRLRSMESIYQAVDRVNAEFGKHTVHLASSLPANRYKQHQGDRGDLPLRRRSLLSGENKRQRLEYPLLFLANSHSRITV